MSNLQKKCCQLKLLRKINNKYNKGCHVEQICKDLNKYVLIRIKKIVESTSFKISPFPVVSKFLMLN